MHVCLDFTPGTLPEHLDGLAKALRRLLLEEGIPPEQLAASLAGGELVKASVTVDEDAPDRFKFTAIEQLTDQAEAWYRDKLLPSLEAEIGKVIAGG